VPFTPAVPAVYGLEAALDELLDEGLEHRQAAYRYRVALLDRAFEKLGLEQTVAAANRSSSVRSLKLPTGVGYDELHDALKRDGYVIYAGLGDAAKTTFRVCTLGALELDVLSDFVESLDRALVEARLSNAAGRLAQSAAETRGPVSSVSA
jgi:2-aminoethylphosphonate-pyruvate transaminase